MFLEIFREQMSADDKQNRMPGPMMKGRGKQEDIARVIEELKRSYKDVSMLGSLDGKSPFYILIATVLSARNRDEQTMVAVKELFSHYENAQDIASAPLKTLEKLVKRSGFYKIKARRIREISRILIGRYGGGVPDRMDDLISLPGVGRKTAGCVLVYAFRKPAIPVDTHVHKIANRLGWVKTKDPLKTEQELLKIVPRRLWIMVNELLVLHGQNTCTPISPHCSRCNIREFCKRIGVKSSR